MEKTEIITDKERILLLAANIMQPAQIMTQHGVTWRGHLSAIDFGRQHWPEAIISVSVDDGTPTIVTGRQFQVTLLKKSLSTISESDLESLGNIISKNMRRINLRDAYPMTDRQYGEGFIYHLLTNKSISTFAFIECVDFLRSKGYALDYSQWSVQQLIDFGIYQIEE